MGIFQNKNIKIIIVVGSQRSGTTLMSQIIGSHPAAVMLDENDRLYDWVDACFNSEDRERTHTLFHQCCKLAASKYREPHHRFEENGVINQGVGFLVLKAPNLTFSYLDIARVFPDAKIVYMQRDIRDVVASMKTLKHIPILKNQLGRILPNTDIREMFPEEIALLRKPNWLVRPYIKLAIVAKIKMSLSGLFQKSGLDVIHVWYEDLVSRPDPVISSVLERLGLPPAAECLRHHQIYQGIGPGLTERDRSIDNYSIGKWQSELSQRQAIKIQEIGGQNFLEKAGIGPAK